MATARAIHVGGQDVLAVRGGQQGQVSAAGAQVERPIGGEPHHRPGERLGRARHAQHVVAADAAVGQTASCATTNPSARQEHHGPPRASPVELDQAELGPVGRVHRRDGAAEVVERDRHAGQEHADQGRQRVAIAGAPQHPGPVERPEVEVDRLVGRQPLPDVPILEARAVQDVADPAHVVGPVEGQRAGAARS